MIPETNLQIFVVKALREYLCTVKDTEGTSEAMARLQPNYKELLKLRDEQLHELKGILGESAGKLDGLLKTVQELGDAVADVAFVHGYRKGDVEGRDAEADGSQAPIDGLLELIFEGEIVMDAERLFGSKYASKGAA